MQLLNRENRSARLIGFAQDNRSYIINKTNNCEKSQENAKNRRPCDFCDFSQVHEKSQISQLRANLGLSELVGRFFEICVKLVKRYLKKVLGNAKLSYEELESVLIETEGVLNSRPLTYVYDELTELAPLMPSHLVIGRRLLDQSPVVTAPVNTLIRRERYLDGLLAHFRNRWKKEYLTEIREEENREESFK